MLNSTSDNKKHKRSRLEKQANIFLGGVFVLLLCLTFISWILFEEYVNKIDVVGGGDCYEEDGNSNTGGNHKKNSSYQKFISSGDFAELLTLYGVHAAYTVGRWVNDGIGINGTTFSTP